MQSTPQTSYLKLALCKIKHPSPATFQSLWTYFTIKLCVRKLLNKETLTEINYIFTLN